MLMPYEFEKRVLVVVSGMSPQILTETVFALTQSAVLPFVPTEVHLLTTLSGARNAQLHLLDKGHFAKLCYEYNLDSNVFGVHSIHVIQDDNGHLLEDIRTPDENETAANFITQVVQRFTQDDATALHVSMAGGRKTMGYYAGYALSLFARPQDRLSHVLVSEQYEGLSEFFYPTRASHLIEGRNKQVLDTKEAKVTLAEIPFVRLRNEIPVLLLEGKASFKETILKAQRVNEPESLVVDIAHKKVIVAGEQIDFAPQHLAYYLWFVARLVADEPLIRSTDFIDDNKALSESFLQFYRDLEGEMGRDLEGTEKSLRNGMDRSWFDERNSRVNKQLEKQLGHNLAKRYQITGQGKRGRNYYYTLLMDLENIIWQQ